MEEARHNQGDKVIVNMAGFRDLYVWREGKALALEIFHMTQKGALSRDPTLRDLVLRSAISVPCHIAEGDERQSDRDTVRFLTNAKGALAQLWTQLEIAHEIRYIDDDVMKTLTERCRKLQRMLGGLIQARTRVC